MAYTTVPKSTDYFTPKLYTGNGGTQTISGIGFEPSFVWFKTRSATSHMLQDAVRGTTKFLESNTNSADQTSSDGISSFNSDGYAIGANGRLNSNGTSMVSWNWKANGQGSSNTAGSINTTYTSASTTSGFSISTYTGTGANATVGHGLGVAPKMIIVKRLDVTSSWRCYHASLGNTKNIVLNTNNAVATSSTMWNNTSPTSTTFSLGSYDEVNGSSAPHVAYCFADVKGYSKIGSYVGTGNANGPFQFLGFKPSWVLIKNTQANETWMLYDDKRGYNGSMAVLSPDEAAAEIFANNIDLLSNGFKIRTSASTLNTNNQTYIYMAIAESPLVGSNNVPATAR